MKKYLKKSIKKVCKKFGFDLVKIKNLKSKEPSSVMQYGKSSLLHNFYSILKKQNFKPVVVYDIGANKGSWTNDCLQFFPDATYYLFEPQINLKNDIDALFTNKKNIQLFSVGVGNKIGELLFTIYDRDDSCTFMLTADEAQAKGLEQVKVPMVQLDTFAIDNNLKPPSILKIDAEGLDLEVLEGAKKLAQEAEIIMIEVGVMNKTFENSALNIMNYLDEIGFRLFDITDLNRPFENNALWLCEFVFIKKNGALDKDYSY